VRTSVRFDKKIMEVKLKPDW